MLDVDSMSITSLGTAQLRIPLVLYIHLIIKHIGIDYFRKALNYWPNFWPFVCSVILSKTNLNVTYSGIHCFGYRE